MSVSTTLNAWKCARCGDVSITVNGSLQDVEQLVHNYKELCYS